MDEDRTPAALPHRSFSAQRGAARRRASVSAPWSHQRLAALAELRERLPIADAPLGLVAGSIGAWVAQSVLADTDLPVSAVALVSPAISLHRVVARYERMWDFAYRWSERSRAVAERLDFAARADEIAERDVATLLAVGALDDQRGFRQPAERLHEALARRSPERTSLVQIPGMKHALAAEPALEPARQSEEAAQVDRLVTDWFRRHVTSAAAHRGAVGTSGGAAAHTNRRYNPRRQ